MLSYTIKVLLRGNPMDTSDSVDLGKKIFFLNPPFDFKKIIIPMLSDLEYETYVIENYRHAKSILREQSDAICFVCIDGEMPIEHWYNFVVSCNKDQTLSGIFFGIMSAHAGTSDRNHFLLNASIPAGFVSLVSKKDELITKLEGILRINNAKGIRKYVRVDCVSDKLISALCEIDGKQHVLRIENISSAGLLCSAPATLATEFSANLLLKDFLLSLRSQKIKCVTVVLKSFVSNGKLSIVLLFTKGLSFAAKSAIQAYIRFFLQNSIETALATTQPDTEDYSKLHESAVTIETDDAFLISVDEEPVVYADDAETVTYADEVDENELSSPLFQSENEEDFLNQMKYIDDTTLDGDVQLIDDTK